MKKYLPWVLPIILMGLITPFISDVDLAITRYIYKAGNNNFYSNSLLDAFYQFGLLPAQATCGITGIIYLVAKKFPRLLPYRQAALACCVSMVIGSGIIAHVTLKEFWGRPRPKQVIEFGGKQQFRPYYLPNPYQPEPSKSLPSGHATCGFYFLIFYLVGKRYHNKLLTYGGLALTVFLGTLLSATRLVQGGHFLSDILIAAILMWESALLSEWLVFDCAWFKKTFL